MKHSFLTIAIASLWNSTAIASIVEGAYGGILLGASMSTQTLNFTFNDPVTLFPVTGQMKFSAFGNAGGQVGFRFIPFRLEVEGFFNSSPYRRLQLGSTIYYAGSKSTGTRMKGQVVTGAGMANAYYDFITPDCPTTIAPYLGVGVGYAYLKHNIKFYANNVPIAGTISEGTNTTPAAQAIAGVSYFLDDFTWFGLDYRYFTTRNLDFFDARFQLNSINVTFNGSFNCF